MDEVPIPVERFAHPACHELVSGSASHQTEVPVAKISC